MGKDWDNEAIAFSVDFWQEVRRVLKPGAHALVFGGTRTYHRIVSAMEDAGLEIRDTLEWVYGSGFPKSTAIDKQLDKLAGVERPIIGTQPHNPPHLRNSQRGTGTQTNDGRDAANWDKYCSRETMNVTMPATPEAQRWQGWGSALKPAHEPICLARKPLSEKNLATNVLKHGTGAINVATTRVGVEHLPAQRAGQARLGTFERYDMVTPAREGRWPANFLLSHHPECKQIGTKKVKNRSGSTAADIPSTPSKNVYGERAGTLWTAYGDEDGLETVEAWNCHPSCPVAELDRQSGYSISHASDYNTDAGSNQENPVKLTGTNWKSGVHYGDGGGASRYFPIFHYFPKASRRERNQGCEALPEQASARYGRMPGTPEHGAKHDTPEGNSHPTVKPLALCRWLCRLITPPGGIVLDPFAGSGSTLVACIQEGFSFIGIEKEPAYLDICRARIAHALR